jgi:hypothetical protein
MSISNRQYSNVKKNDRYLPDRRGKRWKVRLLAIIIILFFCRLCIAEVAEPIKYAVKAGKILTVTKGTIDHGVILIEDGVFKAVARAADVDIPKGYEIIDASDKWVMPGMVEIHSHLAGEGGLNDMVVPTNPGLRIADVIDPEDWNIPQAVASGVTTVHTIPGSGTNLSGFGVLYKLHGKTVDEMLIRELGSMKTAQAYNPERGGGDLGLSRMGMSWILRDILNKAKAYIQIHQAYEKGGIKDEPGERLEYENMRQVIGMLWRRHVSFTMSTSSKPSSLMQPFTATKSQGKWLSAMCTSTSVRGNMITPSRWITSFTAWLRNIKRPV